MAQSAFTPPYINRNTLYTVYNAVSYGADTTGTSDSASAINSAITAANTAW